MKNFFFPAVSILAIACGASVTDDNVSAPTFNIDSVRGQIHKANEKYSQRFQENDTAWYNARYCSDACAMPENMPAVCGVANIQKYYYNDGRNIHFKITVKETDIYGSGAAVIEEGVYDFPDSTGKSIDKGKFIAVWKQENGQWKLYREIWNSDLTVDAGSK